MTTIVTRAGKGTALSWQEADANFTNLNLDKVEESELASSTGSSMVGYLPNGTGAVTTTVQAKLRETVSVKDFGAVGDGVTDDGAEELAAHAESASVIYPGPENYFGTQAPFNLYGNKDNRRAIHSRIQSGLPSGYITDGAPMLWVQKFGNAQRPNYSWDQGAAYFGLIKNAGSAPGVAATAYGLLQGTEPKMTMIGVHGRVKSQAVEGRTWAGWLYVDVDSTTQYAAHGLEINGFNNVVDTGGHMGYGGNFQLLRIVMADSDSDLNRASTALSIGRQTTGGTNNGVWTGIRVEGGSIISSANNVADGEAVRIDGPIYATQTIGGIRLVSGDAGTLGIYRYGISTAEATFVNNNAILMATNQRIRWGDVTTGVGLIGGSNNVVLGNGFLHITNPVSDTAVQVASTKVLGARKTGWASATGTATRTTFATSTVTLPQLAERVKALLDDLISHGLIGA